VAGEAGREVFVGEGKLDQVLDVVTDLSDIVPHRDLDMAVPPDGAPDEVIAFRRAVYGAGAPDTRKEILVTEDDGKRDPNLGKVSLDVVATPITFDLPLPYPPSQGAHNIDRFSLLPDLKEPFDILDPNPIGIKQSEALGDTMRDLIVEGYQGSIESAKDEIHGDHIGVQRFERRKKTAENAMGRAKGIKLFSQTIPP
jgi:hypothetical protein